MKKPKRIWTDDQRHAAAERMAKMSRERWAQKKATEVAAHPSETFPVVAVAPGVVGVTGVDGSSGSATSTVTVAERVVDPEVQAVLSTMTPERKARLAQIQSRTFQMADGQKALERHEIEKIAMEPVQQNGRPGSREISLLVRNDGTMVSQFGPCVCGAAKRQWHAICLKEPAHV